MRQLHGDEIEDLADQKYKAKVHMHSSGLRQLVAAAMAVSYATVVSCSTLSQPASLSPEQQDYLRSVKSISLITPSVNILRQGVTPRPALYERPEPEWAEKARRNIVQAVAKKFGELYTLKESASDPAADAFLFISAYDEIKSESRRAMDTLGVAYGSMLLPLLYVTVVPMVLILSPKAEVKEFNRGMLKAMWPAGLTTIKLEMTNPQSGDILWSFTKESRSGYDLRDYASVESLITEAVEDLAMTVSGAKAYHAEEKPL